MLRAPVPHSSLLHMRYMLRVRRRRRRGSQSQQRRGDTQREWKHPHARPMCQAGRACMPPLMSHPACVQMCPVDSSHIAQAPRQRTSPRRKSHMRGQRTRPRTDSRCPLHTESTRDAMSDPRALRTCRARRVCMRKVLTDRRGCSMYQRGIRDTQTQTSHPQMAHTNRQGTRHSPSQPTEGREKTLADNVGQRSHSQLTRWLQRQMGEKSDS